MTNYHFTQFLFNMFMCANLIKSVLSLNAKSIIGGHYAEAHTIKYQVVIQSRLNFSNTRTIVCGGSIVSYNLVITAAHCFFKNNMFHYLTYSIIADSIDLKTRSGVHIDIDKIYIAYFNQTSMLNDISAATLRKSLDLYRNQNLEALKLPEMSTLLTGKIGKVSGYGLISVRTRVDPETNEPERVTGALDFLLKYASVRIVSNELCRENYDVMFSDLQFCGAMISDFPREAWGICSGDSGGPLVINNTLVGIISRNLYNCDDSIKGCIYTRASAYVHIIRKLMLGIPDNYVEVYHNPPHVLK